MHLAFRAQSEEFLVLTRIKLRDVLRPLLFRIPNFGGTVAFFFFARDKARIEALLVAGMKNGGSKKERDFLSRNIVRYKGEDMLVPYSQKDFHCPRQQRR